MPSKDLLEVIAYLVPGFIAYKIYQSAYPARQSSDYVQTVVSLTFGW